MTSEFSRYSKYGRKFSKAVQTVLSGGVKKHLFVPSDRVIYTVVGSDGDEFIDPQKQFCTCHDFFFKVLGGKEELCYHLLSYKMAREAKRLETVVFSDEEYVPLLRAIMKGILADTPKKEDKWD